MSFVPQDHRASMLFKSTLMTGQPKAVDDLFRHYYNHGHQSLFWVDTTHVILLLSAVNKCYNVCLKIVPTNTPFILFE